jgi:hypothetical protein
MKTVTLLNQSYQVNDRLEQFNINIASSKGVSFFGSNPESKSMFIQFANGGTYIYQDITPEVRRGLWGASSLGSFVSKNIVGKFPSEKLNGVGVSKLVSQ